MCVQVTVLKQQLVEELYPAEMALLSYCVYSNEKGLVVRVEGFSQKLPLLLDAIFQQLARRVADLESALFTAMQESLRRLYHNTFVNPSKLANELRMSLLLQVSSSNVSFIIQKGQRTSGNRELAYP